MKTSMSRLAIQQTMKLKFNSQMVKNQRFQMRRLLRLQVIAVTAAHLMMKPSKLRAATAALPMMRMLKLKAVIAAAALMTRMLSSTSQKNMARSVLTWMHLKLTVDTQDQSQKDSQRKKTTD